MTPKKYPVSTLVDMACIPEDARVRFLAELPAMLDTLAPMVAVGDALGGAYEFSVEPTWIDDDKGLATVIVQVRDSEGGESFNGSATFKHGGTRP